MRILRLFRVTLFMGVQYNIRLQSWRQCGDFIQQRKNGAKMERCGIHLLSDSDFEQLIEYVKGFHDFISESEGSDDSDITENENDDHFDIRETENDDGGDITQLENE